MEPKEKYTLSELYNNLDIPLTELHRRSGMSEGTVTRIRDGHAARRSTINKLLRTFSKIYEVDLSIDNVSGIILEDKRELQSPETASAAKRLIPSDLPPNTMHFADFAERYGILRSTFKHHIEVGLAGEKVDAVKRPKPGRPEHTERFLTPEQQADALEFWCRHGVEFTMPKTEKEIIG
ncbi:MAG TPA: hypothetical protein VN207_11080 [Ktedonobacteraceae bacterium]|nr:hypothetical protein [Ktedonobacteraceae bacterium]